MIHRKTKNERASNKDKIKCLCKEMKSTRKKSQKYKYEKYSYREKNKNRNRDMVNRHTKNRIVKYNKTKCRLERQKINKWKKNHFR